MSRWSCLAIVQSRIGSSRLPEKALADINGKPMIQHVVERVLMVAGARVVLAVPYHERERYESLGLGVDVFSAENQATDDVLGRFAAVALANEGIGPIMRVCGDCPMWSPSIGERVLGLFVSRAGVADYASNVAGGYEDGTDVEVFTRYALFEADRHATSEHDRQHVTPWIRRHATWATLYPDSEATRKTSVDTTEDLERVRDWCKPY
jgi:spore coat polysaccharide biosynthesis protein SpsF (cytidylyltransferase family)